MSQKITNLYRLVTVPFIYEAIQSLLGRERTRKYLLSGPLRTRPGDRVLDVGCGPATLRPFLGDVQYLGMDMNPAHIETAIEKYGDTGQFVCGNAVTEAKKAPGPYDFIICIGLLHHLEDDEASELVQTLSKRLSARGRLVAYDPVYIQKQNPIAKKLKDLDSGQNIRTADGYAKLFSGTGNNYSSRVLSGMLNVPYNHCINAISRGAPVAL